MPDIQRDRVPPTPAPTGSSQGTGCAAGNWQYVTPIEWLGEYGNSVMVKGVLNARCLLDVDVAG